MAMLDKFSQNPLFGFAGGGGMNQAADQYQQIFDRGFNFGGAEFDRAANRTRDRLALEAQGLQQQATNQRLGSGFQGALQRQLGDIKGQQLGAYQQGLVDLEKQQQEAQLKGLGEASRAAAGLGELGLGQGQLGSQSREQLLSFLSDILKTQFGFGGDILDNLLK